LQEFHNELFHGTAVHVLSIKIENMATKEMLGEKKLCDRQKPDVA